MSRIHREFHTFDRIGWLRAAVLGANDGTISVASLVVGVAASGALQSSVLLTGVAGVVAGAMSMAAGEFVSVRSQADAEEADIERERYELETQPERELEELTSIYVDRGLDEPLARRVAEKLMLGNALEAHARDELGITETLRARPIQAALFSAVFFAVGAVIPIASVMLSPSAWIAEVTSATALITLLVLGGSAAYAGGASVARGALRVFFWGALAMGLTAGVGRLFGIAM
ncbi:VIT family protein [Geobacter hydrogenophilus]|uniref:Membrane protein n=1 Tax=Geobacter hydrogenophilus TaxID=40983 RepID=A0A9W6FXU7_9BACT|nr:VIT family protein [Geobacter hydrogenophilus]MBT0895633.1 VIT family protein [Geobacter hydrogenophilus]GLI36819.1 membrane protein [Geobacter hydrogenophilus]